jgi:hypothetical protein
MPKIARFIIWICSKFTKTEIEQIVSGLVDVLQGRNPEVKPKDDFKEKHPNYREFVVPPLAPLTEPPQKDSGPVKDYRQILAEYERTHGKPLATVRYRAGSPRVPDQVVCPCCNAPHDYLYYNDGKKRTQLLCKVCNELLQTERRFQRKARYYFVPIALMPCLPGNSGKRSPSTNAATTTANTGCDRSTSSTIRSGNW